MFLCPWNEDTQFLCATFDADMLQRELGSNIAEKWCQFNLVTTLTDWLRGSFLSEAGLINFSPLFATLCGKTVFFAIWINYKTNWFGCHCIISTCSNITFHGFTYKTHWFLPHVLDYIHTHCNMSVLILWTPVNQLDSIFKSWDLSRFNYW